MRRMKSKTPHSDSLVSEFAEVLRDAMNERGITQLMLAERLNISGAAVSQLLNGESMTVKSLSRIAEAIGIQVTLLISDRN